MLLKRMRRTTTAAKKRLPPLRTHRDHGGTMPR
jgi:hypothetical protein